MNSKSDTIDEILEQLDEDYDRNNYHAGLRTAKAKLQALLLRERKEADNKGHLIGFKNGKWAITSSLRTWIKKRARVTNVQNIDGIRNGQYIRVDELEAELSRLSEEESHE